MNEIPKSFFDSLKDKIVSPIYGVFITTWAVIHWQFVYTLFFVSEDKVWEATGLLKNEYLKTVFFNFITPNFYVELLLTIFFTWFFIWRFPNLISIPAYRQAELNYAEKQKIHNIIEISLRQQELSEVVLREKKIEKEIEIAEAQKSMQENPVEIWSAEFSDIKNHKLYSKFNQILNVLYKNSGKTHDWDNGFLRRIIDTDILALAHTRDLISIEGKDSDEVISLTDKGKSFMSKVIE